MSESIPIQENLKGFTRDQLKLENNKKSIETSRVVNKDFIKLDRLQCYICKNILIDMRKCSLCSTHFCKECIQELQSDQGNKCPKCENIDVKIESGEYYLNKILDDLLIFCKNADKGCEEISYYKYIFDHEAICKHREKVCENCDKVYNYQDYYDHLVDCYRVSDQSENNLNKKRVIALVKAFDEKITKINYDNKYGLNNVRIEIEKSMTKIEDKMRILEKFMTEAEYLVKRAGLEKFKLNSPFSLFGKTFKECQVYYYCKGGYNGCNKTGNVWGSNPYTSDSVICLAALHSGHITKEGGLFIVKKGGPLDAYYGSVKNGLSTQSYGSFDHMLIFPSEINIKISFSNNQCGPKIGICRGRNNNCIEKGDVWGDNPYVKESNLCKAALHSGFINENGGIFMIEESGTHGGYTGTSKNSVTSLPCSSNRASIMIKPFIPY
jgi:hypothetical protein